MCYKIPFLIRVLIKYITHFSSQFNPVKLKVLVAELGCEGVAWNHISPHFATHPYWLLSQPSLLSDVNQTCNISVPLREFFLSIFFIISLPCWLKACLPHTHICTRNCISCVIVTVAYVLIILLVPTVCTNDFDVRTHWFLEHRYFVKINCFTCLNMLDYKRRFCFIINNSENMYSSFKKN